MNYSVNHNQLNNNDKKQLKNKLVLICSNCAS